MQFSKTVFKHFGPLYAIRSVTSNTRYLAHSACLNGGSYGANSDGSRDLGETNPSPPPPPFPNRHLARCILPYDLCTLYKVSGSSPFCSAILNPGVEFCLSVCVFKITLLSHQIMLPSFNSRICGDIFFFLNQCLKPGL